MKESNHQFELAPKSTLGTVIIMKIMIVMIIISRRWRWVGMKSAMNCWWNDTVVPFEYIHDRNGESSPRLHLARSGRGAGKGGWGGGGWSYANETFTCPKRAKLINSPPQTIERWPQKINKTHHGIGSLNETSHPLPPSVPPTVPPPLERLNKLDRLSKWPEKAIEPWEAEAGRQGAFRWQIMATLDE